MFFKLKKYLVIKTFEKCVKEHIKLMLRTQYNKNNKRKRLISDFSEVNYININNYLKIIM